MNQSIGIMTLDYFFHQQEGSAIYEHLKESLPSYVEVLDQNTSALELLDFIEKHNRLIILNQDLSNYGKGTLYGEIEYWGHFIGGMPEEIAVIGMDSLQESIQPVLDCLDRWSH